MTWINVKDRLPETQENVLVFCGKSMRVASKSISGWMLAGSYHEYDKEDEDWDYDAVHLCVTHWMPLPEFPEN